MNIRGALKLTSLIVASSPQFRGEVSMKLEAIQLADNSLS